MFVLPQIQKDATLQGRGPQACSGGLHEPQPAGIRSSNSATPEVSSLVKSMCPFIQQLQSSFQCANPCNSYQERRRLVSECSATWGVMMPYEGHGRCRGIWLKNHDRILTKRGLSMGHVIGTELAYLPGTDLGCISVCRHGVHHILPTHTGGGL